MKFLKKLTIITIISFLVISNIASASMHCCNNMSNNDVKIYKMDSTLMPCHQNKNSEDSKSNLADCCMTACHQVVATNLNFEDTNIFSFKDKNYPISGSNVIALGSKYLITPPPKNTL